MKRENKVEYNWYRPIDTNHEMVAETVVGEAVETQTTWKKWLCDALKEILLALLIAFLFVRVIFTVTFVNGNSMFPTLHDRDFVVLQHICYTPNRGDVIVARADGMNIVKRVIGMPGDVIYIDEDTGVISVNGELLNEAYVADLRCNINGDVIGQTITVRPDHVFVMGDNRGHSEDSRFNEIGQIPYSDIRGGLLFTLRFGD